MKWINLSRLIRSLAGISLRRRKNPFPRYSKRHVLLLEVLIAFALVILCAIPLVYPHVFIVREQKLFLRQIELDQAAGLIYGDILERLYLNAIPWQDIVQGTVFPVDAGLLARSGWKKPLYYPGYYQFSEENHKPKKKGEVFPKTIWLFKLLIAFIPLEYANASEEVKRNNAIKYTYKVFLIRDLANGGEAGQKNEENNAKAPK